MKRILSVMLIFIMFFCEIKTLVYAQEDYSDYKGIWFKEDNFDCGIDISSINGNLMDFELFYGQFNTFIDNAHIYGGKVNVEYYEETESTGIESGTIVLTFQNDKIYVDIFPATESMGMPFTSFSVRQIDYSCYEGSWHYDDNPKEILKVYHMDNNTADFWLYLGRQFGVNVKNIKMKNGRELYGESRYSGEKYTHMAQLYLDTDGIRYRWGWDELSGSFELAKKDDFKLKFKDKINVTVNEKKLKFDQAPIMVNDRVLVPIRKICDAIGAEIYYQTNGELKIISILKNDTLITLTNGFNSEQNFIQGSWLINKRTLSEREYDLCAVTNLNENNSSLDIEPVILNDRTLVPVRVITEYLGANVNWVQETKTVEITMEDTAFSRSEKEIELISDFTRMKADDLFINLPHSYKIYIEKTGFYFITEAFNTKGKVVVYENPGDETQCILIYYDGTVEYARKDDIVFDHN